MFRVVANHCPWFVAAESDLRDAGGYTTYNGPKVDFGWCRINTGDEVCSIWNQSFDTHEKAQAFADALILEERSKFSYAKNPPLQAYA